jgi:hypothetical protein
VLFTQIGDNPVGSRRKMTTTSRGKHHRWRLDKSQADDYGLTGFVSDGSQIPAVLPDDFRIGWEAIGLPQRELHTHVIREATTITALICEDLARSDPCHSILRDIGPNLVISLLLDGAQLDRRWSARYARCLAEDPGSSVLTLTSRGMIDLSNQVRRAKVDDHTDSWSVGLWIDDASSHLVQIHCPPGQHGVVLSLTGKNTLEYTFDGRPNQWASSWRLSTDPASMCTIQLADKELAAAIDS